MYHGPKNVSKNAENRCGEEVLCKKKWGKQMACEICDLFFACRIFFIKADTICAKKLSALERYLLYRYFSKNLVLDQILTIEIFLYYST